MSPEPINQGTDVVDAIPTIEYLPSAEKEPEVKEPAPPAEGEPKPEPPKTEDDEAAILRRVVAGNPQLRQAYEREKYGQPEPVFYPTPAAPPKEEPKKEEPPALPFDEETYDPTDMSHVQALVAQTVGPLLKPFSEYIQHLKTDEQRHADIADQRREAEAENNVRGMMDVQVPGFAKASGSTPEEMAVLNYAYSAFTQEMQQVSPDYWHSGKVHQEVINKIAPSVKALSAKLGVFSSQAAKDSIKEKKASEMMVEGSNAVPVSTANPYKEAIEKRDYVKLVDIIPTFDYKRR